MSTSAMKVYWSKAGAHVHCRVFFHGLAGNLVFGVNEWPEVAIHLGLFATLEEEQPGLLRERSARELQVEVLSLNAKLGMLKSQIVAVLKEDRLPPDPDGNLVQVAELLEGRRKLISRLAIENAELNARYNALETGLENTLTTLRRVLVQLEDHLEDNDESTQGSEEGGRRERAGGLRVRADEDHDPGGDGQPEGEGQPGRDLAAGETAQ